MSGGYSGCPATSRSVSMSPVTGMAGSIDRISPSPTPSASMTVAASRPVANRYTSSTGEFGLRAPGTAAEADLVRPRGLYPLLAELEAVWSNTARRALVSVGLYAEHPDIDQVDRPEFATRATRQRGLGTRRRCVGFLRAG